MTTTLMHWVSIEHLTQLKEIKMLHESIKGTFKEVVIKDHPGFRLVLKKHEVLLPKGLFSIDMVQESLDDSGNVRDTNTYNFFMTQEEINTLCKGLQDA